ncbi:uridine kinase [bacterium]|nr:uridine kinase [bacterium]
MANSITVIAIAGGSGSGKTTLANLIEQTLGKDKVLVLPQDYYYKDQSKKFDGDGGSVNFDHPDSLDFEFLAQQIKELKSGHAIEAPVYDFVTHSRLAETKKYETRPIVVVEGTLLLSQANIRNLCDKSFFIETSEELRLQRRMKRDIEERGREPEGVKKQFWNQVKPMHDEFVEPSKRWASSIVTNDDYAPCIEYAKGLI